MSTATATRFAAEFRAICGQEHVKEDPAELQSVEHSGRCSGIAVTPASADEVAAVLRFANEHGLSVVPAGGFTQQEIGNLPPQIDIAAFHLASDRSGALRSRRSHHRHWSGLHGCATVCHGRRKWLVLRRRSRADGAMHRRWPAGHGIMYGPLRHGYGGLRDYCIGVRFVTGDGRKAKGGGRVVKNVAGYDMMKLFIGSQGTLGVITSASFKLFPAPRQTRTFVAAFAAPRRPSSSATRYCARRWRPSAWRLSLPKPRPAGACQTARIDGSMVRSWFAPPAATRCLAAIAPNSERQSRAKSKAPTTPICGGPSQIFRPSPPSGIRVLC